MHLTWIGEPEQSSEWPDTKIFPTLEDWVQQGMTVDHRENTGTSKNRRTLNVTEVETLQVRQTLGACSKFQVSWFVIETV
jgi:hypothetical protein